MISDKRADLLIESAQLAEMIANKTPMRIVNVTRPNGDFPGDPHEAHLQRRITADTVFFDQNEIRDKESKFKFMMPPLAVFTEGMKKIRVPKDLPIVVYDEQGMYSVARVAWIMQHNGC